MDRNSLWLLSLLFKQVPIRVSGCFAVFLCLALAVALGWFEVRPKNHLLYTDCDVLSLWWMVTEKPSHPICFSSYLLFSKNLFSFWVDWGHPSGNSDNHTAAASLYFVPFTRWHSLRTHSMLYFLLWCPKWFPLPSLLDMLTLRNFEYSTDAFNLACIGKKVHFLCWHLQMSLFQTSWKMILVFCSFSLIVWSERAHLFQ